MALGVLWLGFTLLMTLQTQGQDSPLGLILSPPLSKVPLQKHFKDDQGKWYVLAVAVNTIQNGNQSHLNMYSTTYELKDDHSYNVTSTWLSYQLCEHWIRTFVLRDHDRPGQFTVANLTRGLQSYTMRVAATDYNQFALVFFKMIFKNSVSFETTLYGRSKELSPELKQRFIHFAKSLGLTDDNIVFTDPIDKCIDD